MVEMGFVATVEPSESMLGGGTTPARPIPSWAVRIDRPYPGALAGLEELALSRGLREGETPVIARVREEALWLDLRAVFEAEDDVILAAFRRLANERPVLPSRRGVGMRIQGGSRPGLRAITTRAGPCRGRRFPPRIVRTRGPGFAMISAAL